MGAVRDAIARMIPGVESTRQREARELFMRAALALPVNAGGIAVDPSATSISTMARALGGGSYIDMPVSSEVIWALLGLSVSNPLLSKTVYDAVTLANTDHRFFVDAPNEATARKAALEIESLASRMHPGGLTSWFQVAFFQAVVTGALSHEWIVRQDLRGLERSQFVPVTSIRFRPEDDTGLMVAHQVGRPDGLQPALNPLTYHYRPIMQIENVPYGIPPYASAIEPLWVQRETMSQIVGIARKLGLLGIVQMMLTPPTPKPGESDESYRARASTELSSAETKIRNNLKSGLFVGFKGAHEFSVAEAAGDPAGFRAIWETVDQAAHTAAKNDPSLTGRPYSRTETQIRLVYQILTQQLGAIQRMVDMSVATGLNLHLALAGIGAKVNVERDPINSFDPGAEEMAKQTRSNRILNELAANVIDLETAQQELGYADLFAQDTSGSVRATMRLRGGRYGFEIRGGRIAAGQDDAVTLVDDNWPPPHGEHDHEPCGGPMSLDMSAIDDLIADYERAIGRQTSLAGDTAVEEVRRWLERQARGLEPDQMAENIYRIVARHYGGHMSSNRVRAIVETNLEAIYREARLGTGWAQAFVNVTLPDGVGPVFDGARDGRTLRFLQDTDVMYLGRYIRRRDTAERVKNRIMRDYLAVGRDWRDRSFIESIARDVGLENWQAERIVRTTANTARTFAQIRSYEQVGVDLVRKYEIAGPVDGIACEYCRSMVGRQFSVVQEVSRMRSIIAAGPEALPDLKPFASGRMDIDSFKRASSEDLQAAGLALTPVHPNCRHRTIAVV